MAGQVLTWRVERVAWVCFALICLAGLFGAFGDGPLAHRTIRYATLEVSGGISIIPRRTGDEDPAGSPGQD